MTRQDAERGEGRKGGDAERVSGGTLKSDKFSVRQHACLSERERERRRENDRESGREREGRSEREGEGEPPRGAVGSLPSRCAAFKRKFSLVLDIHCCCGSERDRDRDRGRCSGSGTSVRGVSEGEGLPTDWHLTCRQTC